MSVDKLVDSTQLNTDLTSVANAIRTKSGGSSQLAFPSGFVSAVNGIERGYSADDVATQNYVDDIVLQSATQVRNTFKGSSIKTIRGDYVTSFKEAGTFYNCKSLTSIDFPLLTGSNNSTYNESFSGCSALVNVHLPKFKIAWNYTFKGCTALTVLVLPSWSYGNTQEFYGCTHLKYFDCGDKNISSNLGSNFTSGSGFQNCSSLDTIIIRNPVRRGLAGTSVFNGTPFASGGTGGTIYIPKSLYDHLGDNTSSDYQSATNWSTVYGYGTITWAKIEGSYYETHYADGTEIPTT